MLTPRKGLFAVALVLLLCALLSQHWTGWFTTKVNATVETLQYPAGWLASNAKINPKVDYQDEDEEATLEELKAELAKADAYNKQLWIENRKIKQQVEAFEAIAVIRDMSAIRPVEAKVSKFNDDPVNPTMKLLRGTLHGVKVDDAVVYKSNLLGFVREVGPATCTISLIVKKSYRTEVMITPPKQRRMENNWPVFARAESNGKGGFICDLSQDITQYLREGDVISVSDTLRESANGFVLGVIESIEDHPERPLQDDQLLIRPRTAIGPQGLVTILTERKD